MRIDKLSDPLPRVLAHEPGHRRAYAEQVHAPVLSRPGQTRWRARPPLVMHVYPRAVIRDEGDCTAIATRQGPLTEEPHRGRLPRNQSSISSKLQSNFLPLMMRPSLPSTTR